MSIVESNDTNRRNRGVESLRTLNLNKFPQAIHER